MWFVDKYFIEAVRIPQKFLKRRNKVLDFWAKIALKFRLFIGGNI